MCPPVAPIIQHADDALAALSESANHTSTHQIIDIHRHTTSIDTHGTQRQTSEAAWKDGLVLRCG
eukprot:50741-Eustigmatos_ZCMA.PRE.1